MIIGLNWLTTNLGDGRMFLDYSSNLKITMMKRINGIVRVESGDVKNPN